MPITLDLADSGHVGSDLVRPEGVMVQDDGTVWCSHGGGHCTRIRTDGIQQNIGELGGEPNGICIDKAQNIIIANIGNGLVQLLKPDSTCLTLTDNMAGHPMPTPNFPFIDSRGHIWVTNSTKFRRHYDATRRPVSDGTLCLLDGSFNRIMAEGLQFANGIALDRQERYVYVAETMARCIVRYEILDGGFIGRPEQYGPDLGEMGYPDGIAFDSAGNLWVALVVMNALAVITPERELKIVVRDIEGTILNNPTNICFGGPDLKTLYVGSLGGTTIPTFRVPHPGMPLVHQSQFVPPDS